MTPLAGKALPTPKTLLCHLSLRPNFVDRSLICVGSLIPWNRLLCSYSGCGYLYRSLQTLSAFLSECRTVPRYKRLLCVPTLPPLVARHPVVETVVFAVFGIRVQVEAQETQDEATRGHHRYRVFFPLASETSRLDHNLSNSRDDSSDRSCKLMPNDPPGVSFDSERAHGTEIYAQCYLSPVAYLPTI